MYFVYELVDPRTDVTGYVGITNNPNQRYYEHIEGRVGRGKKYEWIKRLQGEQTQPKMEILEITDDLEQARKREQYWIQYYLSKGTSLTNALHTGTSHRKIQRSLTDYHVENQEEYYTLSQAIKILNVSKALVRSYVERGKIKYIRPEGGRIGLYLKNDIDSVANSRKTVDSSYYTAGETKEILGIDNNTLYKYVRNGVLEKILLPGSKQGVYRKSQVKQLAHELEIFISTRVKNKTNFRKATRQDIAKCIEIAIGLDPNAQQDIDISSLVESRTQWLDKNPNIYYVLERDGDIVGYTNIIPLEPEKIQERLNSDGSAINVMPEEINEFKPGKPLHIYVAAMYTIPDITKTERRLYGVRLIGGLITTIAEMIENGISIDTLYAKSDTVDGIRALKHMGFTEIPSLSTKFRNYMLRMNGDGKRLLEKYKHAIYKTQEK